jgi:hypothetical protein
MNSIRWRTSSTFCLTLVVRLVDQLRIDEPRVDSRPAQLKDFLEGVLRARVVCMRPERATRRSFPQCEGETSRRALFAS